MNAYLDWEHLSFAQPWAFLLLLLIPVLWWLRTKKANNAAFRVSTLSSLAAVKPTGRVRLLALLPALRVLALVALTIALARPQTSNVNETRQSEGIDIVLSLDVSGSMLAEDFKPNRIEAAKKVATQFIDGRPQDDRIGLVIFAGESFTQVPVTIDHTVLKEQLAAIKSGILEDGTAIGMGLATGVDRLRNTTGKSRVLVLLTDGVNNTGLVDPSTALEIAKAYKVRVYTIGVGSEGQAPYPMPTAFGTQTQMMPVQIDEALLKKIAGETGGKYYRATGNSSLSSIMGDIDKLEKTKVEVNSYKQYAELFFPFALIALLALALEMLLQRTVLRSIT